MRHLLLRPLLIRSTPWLVAAILGMALFFVLVPELRGTHLSLLPAALGQGTPAFRILVFSRTTGYRHSSIDEALIAIKSLGQQHDFAVDATEDQAAFRDDNLEKYQAVVFLMTSGDILSPTQQTAFERYIRAGGGYVGIHSASDTEYEWPWYGQLVGAYFKDHPEIQTAFIDVVNRDHPSTRSLPVRWQREDEWYNFENQPAAAVNVLALLDETTYQGGTMGTHPIAWYQEFDGGRSWYTAGGHTEASYSEADFLNHILGGIRYAAGAEPAAPATATSTGMPSGTDTPATMSTATRTTTSIGTSQATPRRAPQPFSHLPLVLQRSVTQPPTLTQSATPTQPLTQPPTPTQSPTPTRTPESAASWQPLFNGQNLDGWYTYLPSQGVNNDPEGVFKVVSGTLHILDVPESNAEREFGYLATIDEYENYHLRFQYRWGKKKFSPRQNEKRDSGVLYHIWGKDRIWPFSAECQVQEGDTGDFFLLGPIIISTTVKSLDDDTKVYQEGGFPFSRLRGRIIKSETRDSLTEWNTVEVIVDGDWATHIVNGVVVNRGRLSRADSEDESSFVPLTHGRIAFQAEGAEVIYRTIEIKSLD